MKFQSRRTSISVARLVGWLFLVILLQATAVPALTLTQPISQNQISTEKIVESEEGLIELREPVAASATPLLTLQIKGGNQAYEQGDMVALELDVSSVADISMSNTQLLLPDHPDVIFYRAGQLVMDRVIDLNDVASNEIRRIHLSAKIAGLAPDGLIELPFQVKAIESMTLENKVSLILETPKTELIWASGVQAETSLPGNRLSLMTLGQIQPMEVGLIEQHHLTNDENGTLLNFELKTPTAFQLNPATPVLLTVAVSDLIETEQQLDQIVVYTRQTTQEEWTAVPFTVDKSAETLSFTTEKTGSFILASIALQTGGTTNSPWEYTYTPPGSSAFTGAAQYSYGFDLPPGVGGLTPQLGIHYNSRGIDNMRFPVMSRGFGLGWSMPQMEITNGNASKQYNPPEGAPDCCHNIDLGLYTLQINGASYNLTPIDGRHGSYKAIGDPSLDIQLIADTINNPNKTGEYWLVRTADGMRYRFGYNADAEQFVYPVSSFHNDSQPRNDDHIAFSWKLDTITNKDGREIRYSYLTNNWMFAQKIEQKPN